MSGSLQEELAEVLNSIYTPENYVSFYDTGYCLAENVTYSNRVDVPDNFNFCSVPLTAQDAFLFVGLALLVASVCMGKLSAIWMLVGGGIFGVINYKVNLGRVSNGISLWLGIQPPDVFFYAFLPPLLTDAAMRLDWYIFKKTAVHIVLMAYIMVIINASILTPFILYGMNFSHRGWDWVHGAVLAAIFAPTDAVSVTAMLKAGGAPELCSVLMEGESLLNDASAVTLYTVFMGILEEHSEPGAVMPTVTSLIPTMLKEIVRLTGIGLGIGLAFAWATTYVLKLLRWRGVQPYVEAITTLTLAYLAFYVAQSPAGGSGVIAVCVYGLYGSATSRWGMLARDEATGIHEAVWDTLAFIANGVIFFWGGISSVNFLLRAASSLGNNAWSYIAIPLIYIFMFSTRFLSLVGFNPLFKLLGTVLTWPQIAFATVAALRGSLSLIMIADYIIANDFYTSSKLDEVNFDICLWTSCFVLMTLLINGPLIGPVMKWTGLSKVTAEKLRLRRKAAAEMQHFTAQAIEELRQRDDGEFLQGANWEAVAQYVDFSEVLSKFTNPAGRGKKAGVVQPGAAAQEPGSGPSPAALEIGKEVEGGAGAGTATDTGIEPPSRPASVRLQALDASEDLSGPLLEVPYLQPLPTTPRKHWAPRPPRPMHKSSSTIDVAQADIEAGQRGRQQQQQQQGSSAAPQRKGSDGSLGNASRSSHLRWLLPRPAAAAPTPAAPAPAPAPAAAGSSAAKPPQVPRRRALHRSFVSAPDVYEALTFSALHPQPPSTTNLTYPSHPSESGDLPDEGSEAVVMLYSKDDAQVGADFEAKYFQSVAPQHERPAPAPLTRNTSSHKALGALPVLGSERDLLGRTAAVNRAKEVLASTSGPLHTTTSRTLSPAPTFSEALKERRKEAWGGEAMDRPPPSLSECSDLDSSSPADLRARVITALQRYVHEKRLAGLLSVQSMRILHYTCEKTAEEVEHHPDAPLRLWELMEHEIRPTLVTRATAHLLAWLLKTFRSAPKWLQSVMHWPTAYITGLLRKRLGSAMLNACEVGVEMYLGLSAAPQIQWVHGGGEEAPLWLLEEVEQQLEGAYEFVVEREAEAPHQYQAIQSYRAAMAVLQRQRALLCTLYAHGTLDSGERDELLHALDRRTRHLEIVGPVWRPPHPHSVLQGLPFMAGVPASLLKVILEGGSMQEYKPGQVVSSSAGKPTPPLAPPGAGVVVSGVVCRQWVPNASSSSAGAAQERREGIGCVVGLLAALGVGGLPGEEVVLAQGNSLGRGPLLFNLPQSVLDQVRELASSGDDGAAALEASLLRLAAAQLVGYLEGDVAGAVASWLFVHHPLAKVGGGGGEAKLQEEMAQRVAKYSSQVLMDILSALPSASVLRLAPGQRSTLAGHAVLMQGSLLVLPAARRATVAGGQGAADVPAPAVLPRLASQRLFSFYGGPEGSRVQGDACQAGSQGALLVVCS